MSVRTALMWILTTAVLLRVGAAVVLQRLLDHRLQRQFLVAGDAEGYWQLGEAIAAGKPYRIYDPPRAVLRMPGFPFLLAVGMKTADVLGLAEQRPLVVRLWLAVLGGAVCGTVYLLGRDLSGPSVGLIATAGAAVSPAFIGYSVLELSETAFAGGLVLSLWTYVRLAQRLGLMATADASSDSGIWNAESPAGIDADSGPSQSLRLGHPAERTLPLRTGRIVCWAIAAGLAAAVANFLRPSWMLAPPAMAAMLLLLSWRCGWERRLKAGLAGAVLLASFFAALFPWAWRNERVTGHWIWTTLWVGPSLYDGWNPEATGDSDMRFFEEDRLPERMSEYDVDREYHARAVDFARHHPGRVVQLAFVKAGRYWNPMPNAAQFSQWWIRWPLALTAIAVFSTAVLGIWNGRRCWVAWAICAAPIFYFAAVHSVFVGSIRYRLPAEYPLLVVSALGFQALISRNGRIGLS